MALILVRHPATDAPAGTCYGRTDLEAAPGFEAEAAILAAHVGAVDRIVASPLRRCLPLARLLAGHLRAPLELDARWAEMDFGAWENCPWAAIPRAELEAWAADLMHARPHGGESVAMLQARTAAALADCRARGGCTIVVTHAGPMRAAVGDWNRAIAHGEAIEL